MAQKRIQLRVSLPRSDGVGTFQGAACSALRIAKTHTGVQPTVGEARVSMNVGAVPLTGVVAQQVVYPARQGRIRLSGWQFASAPTNRRTTTLWKR